MTIREDLSNLCTEVSHSVIEVGTVAVATDLDARSELPVSLTNPPPSELGG